MQVTRKKGLAQLKEKSKRAWSPPNVYFDVQEFQQNE